MNPSESENPAGPDRSWGEDAHPSYRLLAGKLKALPWRTAAPSWVVPGSIIDSCRFLDGPADALPLVDEVALAFFEASACLAYTEADLPRPGRFRLDYHVHLPMDLPWDAPRPHGPDLAAHICLELAAKAAHLEPRVFVLHPPQDRRDLERFVAVFRDGCAGRLLLENIEARAPGITHDDLPGLARDLDLGLCLDLGHLLAYNQQSLVPGPASDAPDDAARDFRDRVDMLHLCAPGPGGRHAPLTDLDATGEAMLRTLLQGLRPGATVVLELFEAQALLDSARRLADLAEAWGLAPALCADQA